MGLYLLCLLCYRTIQEITFFGYLLFFIDMKSIIINTGFQFIIPVIITWLSVASSRNIDPGEIV